MTPQVSADEIASHIICPKQWEFDHRRSMSPRGTHSAVVRQRRRELLREALIAGLKSTPATEQHRIETALDRIEEYWQSSSYLVAAQQEYDRSVVEEAVRAYFTGVGEDHADHLLETELTLSYSRDGVTYTVDVDALVGQDNQRLAINYRPTLEGVLQLWSEDTIHQFRTGQKNYRRQIASFARAGVAIRALLADHGFDAELDFAYIGVLADAKQTYDGDGTVEVSPNVRRFYNQFNEESDDMRDLLESKAQAIQNSSSDPTDADFQNIIEGACEYCPYQDACPDKIGSAIAFTDRSTDQSTPHPDIRGEEQSETGDFQ